MRWLCNLWPFTGAFGCWPIGINLTGRNSVVVQNCKVEGFGTNIYLYNSTMNMLLQNEVSRGVFGIYLDGSSYNTLFNNTANYNNFTGVELYSGSEYNTVKYCEASHTSTVDVWVAGSGFEVSNSNYNYLGDNNASYNRMDCFNLKSSGHNYLENNLAYNCTTGFELRLALHNTLLGNNATHNVNGMSLVAAYNKVENNEIEWNDEHGIKMKVTDNNVIANNTILGNQIGIGISEEFATNNHNAIGQNTLMQNAYGLLLKGEWMQNEVFENTFVDNTEYGAYLVKSSGLEPTLNSFWMNVFIAQPMHTAYEGENVTMNRWDLGYNYSGNYWSDFELNPGYPNHYEIHGPGDGIDNYPVS
ncbi:hypothetical protein DRN67_01945 [Candidatus Micrarchaeota archaeon]|nr:MAG: hypothetical protein DRN67_01945 [Candidatus Micrarchaeota archaeon]